MILQDNEENVSPEHTSMQDYALPDAVLDSGRVQPYAL